MCDRVLLVAVLLTAWGCSDEGGHASSSCDPGEVQAALAAAGDGDTVRIGACRLAASIEVPAGVTLEGAGMDDTVVVGEVGTVAVTVHAGEGTTVRNLSIESDGTAGLVADGSGGAALEHVRVTATRGIAIGAEGLDDLTLTNVALEGPVDAANASSYLSPISSADVATHGLVLVRVGAATLSDVTASGFASFGALFVESNITWSGGGAPSNLGTGLMAWDGVVTLTGLDLSGTFEGLQLLPAYGGVFAGGADVDSTSLRVSDSEGYGLLHSEATARHIDLTARNNDLAAVWLQNCDGFELSGAGTGLVGNGLAGVVAVDSSDVTIRHAHVDATVTRTVIVGETGSVEVGDGIQLVGTVQGVTLEDLTLSSNARVGILMDLAGGDPEDFAMSGVSVDGSGEQLGVVAQGGTFAAGWDDGVTRQGATAANDAALAGDLDIVGIVGPSDLPPTIEGLDALLSR